GTTAGLHRLNRQLIQLAPIDGTVLNAELTRPDDLWASTPYGLARLAFADGARPADDTRQERRRVDHIRCRWPWSRSRKPGDSLPDTRRIPDASATLVPCGGSRGRHLARRWRTRPALERTRVLGLRAASRR